MADEVSRKLYSSILEFRLTGNNKVLPAPDSAHQYFPLDIPSWKTPLRLVDCGAFDGDTLLSFFNNGIKLDAVVAFEPDPVSFKKLTQFISANTNKNMENLVLFPCAVFPFNETINNLI